VRIISVGKNVCTATYNGYDVPLNQREVSYNIVPDLRDVLHPGDMRNAVITEWNPKEGLVNFSIKATERHPFDGIDVRHPLGSVRVATIAGKYAGGVFCRLFDGVTDVLCTYDALQYDGDFAVGTRVEILVKKFNREKKLVYGKILRKMY
jgi:ribosomal protein S1